MEHDLAVAVADGVGGAVAATSVDRRDELVWAGALSPAAAYCAWRSSLRPCGGGAVPVDAVVVGERDGRGSATPNELMTVLRAVPAELPGMRARLRAWLNGLGWSVPEAEDVELAVSEAVSNVIDHAYQPDAPGLATVHGWLADDPHTNGRRVIVAVIDRGRWAAHQPASPLTSVGGHGLLVMSACMDQVHIQRGAAGTTVILVSLSSPSADGVAGGARRIA